MLLQLTPLGGFGISFSPRDAFPLEGFVALLDDVDLAVLLAGGEPVTELQEDVDEVAEEHAEAAGSDRETGVGGLWWASVPAERRPRDPSFRAQLDAEAAEEAAARQGTLDNGVEIGGGRRRRQYL